MICSMNRAVRTIATNRDSYWNHKFDAYNVYNDWSGAVFIQYNITICLALHLKGTTLNCDVNYFKTNHILGDKIAT